MKQNFNTKYYDVLIGGGPGGSNLYTTVLSGKQKHTLAMMDNPDEVHKALKELRLSTPNHIEYVQEEYDIKKYLIRKLRIWKALLFIALAITGIVAGLTVFVYQTEPIVSERVASLVCFLSLLVGYIAYTKSRLYHKQCCIMHTL